MRAPTVISGFSGGGLADIGYQAAGYTPIGAVEFEPAIAEVYRANVGDHVRCESIMDTDWSTFDRPDLLHMSPECKEFSQAKTAGTEGPMQRAQAAAICRALETLTPPTFVLENVIGYRKSQSLARILATLSRLGYMYQLTNCNAADFGVPQTRRRLIVRAVRGGLVPHFPRKVKWGGWYEAIADLIPTLPESAFAPWQLARLTPLFEDTLVHPTETRHEATRSGDEPAFTVMGNSFADSHAPMPRPRAFLIGGGNTQLAQVDSKPRWDDAPAFTVAGNESATTNQRAFLVPGGNASSFDVRRADEPSRTIGDAHRVGNIPRTWLEQGRVVAMTPRALARFQSVPDSYQLPESRTLACTVIGNGVPCLLAEAIGRSLLELA